MAEFKANLEVLMMLGAAMYTTIKTLLEKGFNKMQIAKITKHDWKTVHKVVDRINKGVLIPTQKPHPSILDPFKESIIKFLEEGLSAVRIHEELLPLGSKAKYGTVKQYVRNIKKSQNIFMRIHTSPGEEAQVDFGYVGMTKDNNSKSRKTWVFNMRLSYSREDYYMKVYDQRVETFIRCHINAFDYFGGIPEYVKIDNLKAAVLEANFYGPVYQSMYKDFADYYGFKPLPCRIYTPNDKGKVESGVKYVKNNFFKGRSFKNGDELDKSLYSWMDNVCNQRIHGTTRKVPHEVFLMDEKRKLKPLPKEEYKLSRLGTRKVYHDCHIFVDYNYYSVPYEYIGKEVDIELTDSLLKVFYQCNQIAIHPKLKKKGEFQTKLEHYPKHKRLTQTEYQEEYKNQMAQIGPNAERLFLMMMKNNSREWSRPTKGILSLLKTHSRDVIDLSCKRGLAYDVYNYQTIKNICENGSYNLPCDFDEIHNAEGFDMAESKKMAREAN